MSPRYLAYSDRFGYFTPFTLYLVDGRWVLDPAQPAAVELTAGEIEADRRASRPWPTADQAGTAPDPRIERIDNRRAALPHHRGAGAGPTGHGALHQGRDHPEFVIRRPSSAAQSSNCPTRNQVIACYAVADGGTANYRAFRRTGHRLRPCMCARTTDRSRWCGGPPCDSARLGHTVRP